MLEYFISLSEWLAHSKTCPQCREKCANKSVIKLYLDSSASEEDRDLTDLDSEQLKVWDIHCTVSIKSTLLNSKSELTSVRQLKKEQGMLYK